MVEICIEALYRIFLTNENKFDLIFKSKMLKEFKLNF